jgi:DNA processing protein
MRLALHDPDYPDLLRRTPDPPKTLHVAGDPTLLWHPGLAIVGSRAPTAGGRETAFEFARAFAASGFSVISGLASGIDTAAHAGALSAGGHTIAVVATGVDIVFPARNAKLHARIAATGAVASEYPPGTPAHKGQFPRRNRIIAGLALGTLVVEAAHRSGALITARLAADAGREVFALPGSIHNPMARGCHRLIRQGAALVESPREVIEALAPVAEGLANSLRERMGARGEPGGRVPFATNTNAPEERRGRALQAPTCSHSSSIAPNDPDYQKLWRALGHDPTGMDALVSRTGLTAAALSSMLLLMELDGRVVVEHGRYSRKR